MGQDTSSSIQHGVGAYRCKASGESVVIRDPRYAGKLSTCEDGIDTLYANFQKGVKSAGDRPCLGTRTIGADGTAGAYVWESYNQVNTRLTNLGSGFVKLGLQKGDFVGLYSSNRAEWVIAEQACNAYGLVSIPLYDTLGPEAVEYIVNQTQMTTVVCSESKLEILLGVQAACPSLRYAVSMDAVSSDSLSKATSAEVLYMKAIEAMGAKEPLPHAPAATEDLATICYTSGTTGNPKGAMLKNSNFAASLASLAVSEVQVVSTDVHLSYLPLAHMFERIVQTAIYNNGAAIGFYQGDVTKLLEDLAVLKPTIFPSVPRLFNRIYDKLVQGVAVAGGVKKFLFDYAFASKQYYLAHGHTTHKLWDKLVFEKVRALLGGNVRLMITGSAPISSTVKDFLQVVFCCPILEGYGLTETCAVGTMTPVAARYPGQVGIPATCCEIKLVDIPDMNYRSSDKPFPRGEVCFRGANVFAGYYLNKEKTDECMDADGWFHTGDVGRLNADMTLSIIDRKKNIFKLAQGEYIAPEKIENIYSRSPFVAQAFVYGDSLQAKLVGVVVPDPEVVEAWQTENKVAGDFAAVCGNAKLKAAIEADMKRVAGEGKLRGFERVAAFIVEPEPFAVENGCLTPTFKLKRNQLKLNYKEQIEAMYASLG